jgi:uncharacterized membrane protein
MKNSSSKTQSRPRFVRGQLAIVLTLVIPALVALIGFGTDLGVLYFNWLQLQSDADGAVLAGATYLPANPQLALRAAGSYADVRGIKADEIVSAQISGDRRSISIKVSRNVPHFFARFLGVADARVVASSTADLVSAPAQGIAPAGTYPALPRADQPI